MLAPPVLHRSRVESHQLGSIPGGPRPPALVASSATRLLERSLGRNKTGAASHAAGRRLLLQVGRGVTQLVRLEDLTFWAATPQSWVGELDYLGGDPTSSWSYS